jgi:hypothetical protein
MMQSSASESATSDRLPRSYLSSYVSLHETQPEETVCEWQIVTY